MGWRLMQFLNNVSSIIQPIYSIENDYTLAKLNIQIFIMYTLVNIVKHKENSGNSIELRNQRKE
jgi:hypothetical protein